MIYRLDALGDTSHLPFSIKILLENLLRREDGDVVHKEDVLQLANWQADAEPSQEIAYMPARVLMQDFTGVPAVVDLAAMRDAMAALGGDPDKINPLVPAELVIDHSVQVDVAGNSQAFALNVEHEFQRNQERYSFLKWGQTAFETFKVVPPDAGIVHQINLEYLARTVFVADHNGEKIAYPDTLVGTDSHTTMINGLGVLGWGVGGIEAEAAMLGQSISMLVPRVVGMQLTGSIAEGITATDVVLRIVEILREHGVVSKFVEFYGKGLDALPLADRATIANMAPEYGATCGIFPIDDETLNYLRLSGRNEDDIALVEAYARQQGMFRDENMPTATYSETLSLDLSSIEPALAGPKRPQDRVPLRQSKSMFVDALQQLNKERSANSHPIACNIKGQSVHLEDGAVVLAAITSCTNTSNPSVMLGAGLLAKNAAALGMQVKPWVKTSLGPGSRVVHDYLAKADCLEALESLGFHIVGYGCTTCIGNSGPLDPDVSAAITEGDLSVCSVLSGNRNFEGRVHAEIRMNYLASPALVVAYALAGSMNIDPYNDALGCDKDGNEVFLRDIWPSQQDIANAMHSAVTAEQFRQSYASVFAGDQPWQQLQAPTGDRFAWDTSSTYIQHPPYFQNMSKEEGRIEDIHQARVLALLGDSVTTDHISPAGAIKADSPAGRYLQEQGVDPQHFNSYGSRRGNHEVMMRGTFANIRLRNLLAAGTEGGVTLHLPEQTAMSIYDAAMQYQAEETPCIIIAGKEYGTGSSRDWAAKGSSLLGVRAVIAESFERIHRSNLVGMGIIPLQFMAGDSAASLGLTGHETFSIEGLNNGDARQVKVSVRKEDGSHNSFTALVRIDTPKEAEYCRHGGILQYVLRQLAAA